MSDTTTFVDPAVLQPNERIAKIERTTLGYEDHGILTCWLHCTYGASAQGVGGYGLDAPGDDLGDYKRGPRQPTIHCGRWVAGVLRACGVSTWESVKGRSVIVILDGEGWNAMPIGIRPLPTENGEPFYFKTEDDR